MCVPIDQLFSGAVLDVTACSPQSVGRLRALAKKNRKFYEMMIAFVLAHLHEFADHLGIEINDE